MPILAADCSTGHFNSVLNVDVSRAVAGRGKLRTPACTNCTFFWVFGSASPYVHCQIVCSCNLPVTNAALKRKFLHLVVTNNVLFPPFFSRSIGILPDCNFTCTRVETLPENRDSLRCFSRDFDVLNSNFNVLSLRESLRIYYIL